MSPSAGHVPYLITIVGIVHWFRGKPWLQRACLSFMRSTENFFCGEDRQLLMSSLLGDGLFPKTELSPVLINLTLSYEMTQSGGNSVSIKWQEVRELGDLTPRSLETCYRTGLLKVSSNSCSVYSPQAPWDHKWVNRVTKSLCCLFCGLFFFSF